MSFYVAPSQQRTLRACMVCSLVQLHSKFMREGCPNCDNVLGLRGNNDAIQECTSQVFEGLVTLRDPMTSWVARWQRLDSYVPGTYAVKVTGSVSTHTPRVLLPVVVKERKTEDENGIGLISDG
ncbi:transcription elongation factor SPT4 [Aspergillus brasiliensis]|nr:transcription elongation factor SPT4 [Aspergillus brasiliensis]